MIKEKSKEQLNKPLVSIILPAYNEEALVEKNVNILYKYLDTLSLNYDWEVLLVNDGSKDHTGELAEEIAKSKKSMRVIHHKTNRNLGVAMRTGFSNSKGDYVIVMDIDMSYSPDHIERLLTTIVETDADMVIASPYMKGGKNTNVPFMRLMMSKTVNWMMRVASGQRIFTFTSMVRVYNGSFVRSLNTKSSTYDINPELILKTKILRSRIVEIPAHLDWTEQKKLGKTRTSNLRIFKGIINGLFTSFIFRPYVFFWFAGGILLLISLYIIIWIFINTFHIYPETASLAEGFEERFGLSVSKVFNQRPYSFIVGSTTLIISIQILGLGFLSLQKKRYFDELFHLNSGILKKLLG